MEQSSGKKVPVVQAYWGTKYLGFITINFSEDGEMLSWNNTWKNGKTPILLDGSHKQGTLTCNSGFRVISRFCISYLLILISNDDCISFHADPWILEKIRPWKEKLVELGSFNIHYLFSISPFLTRIFYCNIFRQRIAKMIKFNLQ